MPAERPDPVVPLRLRVPDADLADLRARLRNTRWPEPEPVPDWSQGVPLAYLRELCGYWAEGHDWRRVEARLNDAGQFRTTVDGLGVHFLHVRSAHPDALPLVLTHGWPGSVLEFLELLGPLSDPTAHCGSAADAFHVVVPSLPGYGLSDRPTGTGWGIDRTARAWAVLMDRLGYARYGAAGSDWGTSVSSVLATRDPEHVIGIHLIPPLAAPDRTWDRTGAERAALAELERRSRTESAYSEMHRTKPQTIGYGLVDSPVALAAWIVEKLWTWSDHRGDLAEVLTADQVLDDVSLYWLTGTGASAARSYWEAYGSDAPTAGQKPLPATAIPFGFTTFPGEIWRTPRSWVEASYPNVIYFNEVDKGGHFAAWEEPELFSSELREAFRSLR